MQCYAMQCHDMYVLFIYVQWFVYDSQASAYTYMQRVCVCSPTSDCTL